LVERDIAIATGE